LGNVRQRRWEEITQQERQKALGTVIYTGLSSFYVVWAPSQKFGLHAGNMKIKIPAIKNE
jgi:hypothetical protein